MRPSKKPLKIFFALILSSFFIALAAASFAFGPQDGMRLLGFEGEAGGLPQGWKLLKFPNKRNETRYTLLKEGPELVLKAESSAAASALYKEMQGDIKDFPFLSWSWKIEGTLKKGDSLRKDGDDYPARVYVTFEYEPQKASVFDRMKRLFVEKAFGVEPPGNAISYVWANKLQKGQAVPNPFTEKVYMVAVETGEELKGQWVSEERNVYEDYRRLFKSEPPKVMGVVIMTDTDNTEESAVAWYRDIAVRKGL